MSPSALWIRRCCRVLIALQVAGVGWCSYGIVRDLLDNSLSEYFTAGALVPWFIMVLCIIAVLLFLTVAVLKNSEERRAWFGMLILVFITNLPFTSQLMNWIRR